MFWYINMPGKCDGATCTTLTACMTDPTSTLCTNTYGGSSSLPSVVAGLSDDKSLPDIDIKIQYNYFHWLKGKCDSSTCTTLTACMTDPTSTACTNTYGGATTLPSIVAGLFSYEYSMMYFSVIFLCKIMFFANNCILGKCDSTTCTTLTAYMTDPTSATCNNTYSASTTLPLILTCVCNKCMKQ